MQPVECHDPQRNDIINKFTSVLTYPKNQLYERTTCPNRFLAVLVAILTAALNVSGEVSTLPAWVECQHYLHG